MSAKKSLYAVLLGLIIIAIGACIQSSQSKTESLSELALKGKTVFEANECNKCHYIGDEEVEAGAPDLTHPLLANDSLFVQAHLHFVEDSQMPPIDLTDDEMQMLSYYIAELHASKHPTVNREDADELCPVCYAPVLAEQAQENKLVVDFMKEKYYFECEECMKTFKKSPGVFVELLKDYYIYHGDFKMSLQQN